MNSNWERAKEIFAAGIEIDPAKRGTYLDEACAGDADLRRDVESLLASDQAADTFMSGSAVGEVADVFAASATFEEGTILGQYEIIELIGSGGMGEIYLAMDNRLLRKVALKLLPSDSFGRGKKMQRFAREARVVSALNHPNIITIHDFGTHDGENFIVSEYVDGITLREKIAGGQLSIAESIDIATQIAAALASAHKAGVIHRDIKPENVMIRPDGVVKVLDFGIAKLVERSSGLVGGAGEDQTKTGPGTILGTVNYMSPEQARGKPVDPRSDIFSFGIVFFEMLTCRLPFVGETSIDTIGHILHKEPIQLKEYVPHISPEIEGIVERMLEKEPDKRFQTAVDIRMEMLALLPEFSGQPNRSSLTSNIDNDTQSTHPAKATGETEVRTPSSQPTRYQSRVLILLTAGIFLIALAGSGYWLAVSRAPDAREIRSIAVMPFVNATGNTEQEYLSDGMTETLISGLTRLAGFRVKARSSVFRYKGKETNTKLLGAELGVQAVVNGRISGRGDDLVLNVELVDTRTEDILWSANYNRKSSDLVALQSEIARDLARKLLTHVSSEDRRQIEKNTGNYEAFQHYLKGRFFWNKRSGEDLKRAVGEFEQAVVLDPNFALAFVGLADTYALHEQYLGTPSSETLPKAKANALRALELDDSLAEAHSSMGFVYYTMWEWDAADAEFKRAIDLNPNYSSARHWYYVFLRDTGRLNEALEQIKIAKELDPLSLVINISYARAQFLAGNTEAGFVSINKVIELYPNYAPNYFSLGLALIKEGRRDEGLNVIKKVAGLDLSPASISQLGNAYALTGRTREAHAIIKELAGKFERREALARQVAAIYVGLNDRDQAFEWLEKDFASRSSELAAITSMQEFDPVRGDPRYKELLRRMNLKP